MEAPWKDATRKARRFAPDGMGMVTLARRKYKGERAAVRVLALRASGIVPAGLVGRTWRVWWVGDLMGDLLVGPLLLLAWARPRAKRRPHLSLEIALALPAIASTVSVIFLTRRGLGDLRVPVYLLFPVLVGVAARFAQYGAAVGNFLAA